MKVSVIIPTYNEVADIVNCLQSLEGQSLKDFEVIVVDDGSNDGTRKLLKTFKTKRFPFRSYEQHHEGPAVARNRGAKHSRGKILVFVDADMTFDKDFLKRLIEPIENSSSIGTFSKEEYVSNWNKVVARCWNYMEGWEDKKRHPKNYPDTQRVYRSILKSEFEKAGGFTKGGYTDDYTLYDKLGKEATAVKGAKFYHRNPDTFKEVFDHAKWVGKREYKLGIIGIIVALARSSLPAGVVKGIVRSIVHKTIVFLPFQVAYDSGIFIGVLEYVLLRKGAK